MAKVLLERETVEGEACQALLDGKWDEYLLREGDIIAAKEREEAEARAADERKLAAEAAVQPAGALGDANADNPYANPYGVSGYAQTYGSGAQPAKPVEPTPLPAMRHPPTRPIRPMRITPPTASKLDLLALVC